MSRKSNKSMKYGKGGLYANAIAPVMEKEFISVPELRAILKGRVIAPEDPEYDKARTVLASGVDRRPSVIARAADAVDVSKVVSLAGETGVELAIRSGGHSLAGHSVSEGGIVLDLLDMQAIDIDIKQRTAWAQTGLTAGAFMSAIAGHGLMTGFGDTATVGIGGITVSGGVGYLTRKYGLTIDNLVAAEIVTADGQLLRVDAETFPDLFWAIRGGGGNFGVATRFQYRLHQVKTVVGGMLILPATPDVIASFITEAETAPEELTGIVNIMAAPPMPFLPAEVHGKLIVMATLAYAGGDEAGLRAVAPFRTLAAPIVDMIQPMRYLELYPPEQEGFHPTTVSRTTFVDSIDRQCAGMIVDTLQASDAMLRVVQLRVLGGAAARVPNEATAYAHRQRRILGFIVSNYVGEEDRIVRQAWVEDFAVKLSAGNPGAYVAFLGDEGEDRIREAYPGATWDRLTAIKSRYDPTNLFRLNQNIPPIP